MPSPQISVIVPVYNTEKYLRRCIDSILAQTFTDFELLLIDDGSTDGSGAICDEYALKDSRVRVFHESNSGVSSARNLGLNNVRGEWISFVDSDDWIDTDYYRCLMRKAENANADVVMCDFYFATDNNQKQNIFRYEDCIHNDLGSYISTVWNVVWNGVHRRILYERYNILFPLGITFCEDFHVMVRLLFYAQNVQILHSPLYYYYNRDDSACNSFCLKSSEDEIDVCTEIKGFLQENQVYKRNIRKSLAQRLLKATQEFLLNPSKFKNFQILNQGNIAYVIDCPYLNIKLKILGILVLLRLTPIARLICKLRKLLKR